MDCLSDTDQTSRIMLLLSLCCQAFRTHQKDFPVEGLPVKDDSLIAFQRQLLGKSLSAVGPSGDDALTRFLSVPKMFAHLWSSVRHVTTLADIMKGT